MNIVVLQGTLPAPPRILELPSGEAAISFDVVVREVDRPVETVPVVWFNPTATAATWQPGQEVFVAGRVRRRFFRAGGHTASRTEVLGEIVAAIPTKEP